MLTVAPARTVERGTTNEVSTKVVPAIDLVLETFKAGKMIRQETLGTIYATQTTSKPTRHYEKIIDRTIAANGPELAAGQTVTANTLRGRPVAQIRGETPQPAAAAALRGPAHIPAITMAALADLILPAAPRNAAPRNANPFTALAAGIALKATAGAIAEATKKDTPEKEREKAAQAQQQEQKKNEEQLTREAAEFARTRAEVTSRLAGKAPEAKGTAAAALQQAQGIVESSHTIESAQAALQMTQVIEQRIELENENREEEQALRFTAQPAQAQLLAEQYQSEGADGRFKTLILEALTEATPALQAQHTLAILENSDFGRNLIAQVTEDLADAGDLADAADRYDARGEQALETENGPEYPTLETEYLELAGLNFPAGLRGLAAEERALALAA